MFRHPFSRATRPEQPARKQWLCISCLTPVALDPHGRCSTCGSDAVDRIINLDVSDQRLQVIDTPPRSAH